GRPKATQAIVPTKRKRGEEVQVYIRKGKTAEDQSGAFYAPFVEFGSRGLPGSRWFTKSLESNRKTSFLLQESVAPPAFPIT
ncbi:MAG: hypothetical protein WD097_08995, partial [Balneolales bacterium]